MRLTFVALLFPILALGFLPSCKTGAAASGPGQTAPPGNPYSNPPGYSGRQGGGYPSESDYVQVAPVSPSGGGGAYQAPSYPEQPPASSGGGSYTVQKGDTLYGISRRHSTTVAALKSANQLASDVIKPGQVLRIP